MKAAVRGSEDDALYKKIIWRIMPFLFVCYVVNFIDRVNVGFAKLQFVRDLNLTEAIFGVSVGVFFIGYVLFEVPSNLMLARYGVRKTLMRIMVTWGVCTVLLMFVKGAVSLYVLRFLLGAAEAGFFPGIILYLSFWFPESRRGKVTGLFTIAIPLSGIVGGPLSGAIMTHMNGVGGLFGWQWLFLIEGIPAIALGLLALACLTDRPDDATWLSDEEKLRVRRALGENTSRPGDDHFSGLKEALRNPRVYVMTFIYFTMCMGLNVSAFWIPTLLHQAGVEKITTIGWISGGISLCTAISTILVSRSSDHFGERRWHVAGSGFAVAAALLLLPLTTSNIPATVGLLAIVVMGLYSTLTIFWTIPTVYLKGKSTVTGIAMVSSIGAIGAFVSPSIIGFMRQLTGSYFGGLSVVAAALAVGMITLLMAIPARCAQVDDAMHVATLE